MTDHWQDQSSAHPSWASDFLEVHEVIVLLNSEDDIFAVLGVNSLFLKQKLKIPLILNILSIQNSLRRNASSLWLRWIFIYGYELWVTQTFGWQFNAMSVWFKISSKLLFWIYYLSDMGG